MGGNRRQPPKPPALPPVASSKTKDYSMEQRPSEVQNELDDLRNRGIAKVLNRHFTDTTKKLAKEKASADAALADLERRRAQTSVFVPSKGGDLNPFDSMYVELQSKRAECRRKERETMLLYQRYVHKYGKKNAITAANAAAAAAAPSSGGVANTPPNAAALAVQELSSPARSSAASTPEVPPPPSPLPNTRTATLQPLDENLEVEVEGAVDADVNFSKFYNKQIQENSQAMDPPAIPVGAAAHEDSALEAPARLLEALTPPRLTSRGGEEKVRFAAANDPPEEEASRITIAPAEDLVEDVKKEGVTLSTKTRADPPVDAPAVRFAAGESSVTKDTPIARNNNLGALHTGDGDEPEEETTNEKLGWGKTLFPEPEETAAAATDSNSTPVETTVKEATERLEILSDTSHSSNRPTREVTTEVPSATETTEEEEEYDDDDRSVISGLTMTSQVTRQVMEEIEHEMNRFLNTETEAVRKMLDEEDKTLESTILNESSSLIGDETKRASMKAEAMAREMQKILDEYANEDQSESNHFDYADETTEGDVDTVGDTVATNGSEYPKKYETSDPTKNWMVYYDEKFHREYYFEKNSNTTQWEAPGTSSSESESRMFSEEMAPQSTFKRTRSRRGLYRKKIRKRRIRRFAAVSLFVLVAGGSAFHWQTNHPDKTYPEAMVASLHSTSERIVDVVDVSLYMLADKAEFVKDQIEYTFTNRKVREEEHAARQLEEIEKKHKAQELAEKEKLRMEAEQKAAEARRLQEEKERKEAEAQKVREEAKRRELELQAKEVKRKEKERAVRRGKVENKALQRPWGCFLPLAYFHPRCNKLAKQKPLFKDTDVLNSFLQ